MKTYIVDDEILSRDLLRSSIEANCPELEIIGESANINDACREIAGTCPDVVFLDIEMPGGDGFELLERLNEKHRFKTIFFTAHEKYARHAIKAGAADYLLKPLEEKELISTVKRIAAHNEYRRHFPTFLPDDLEKKIVITQHRGYSLVRLKDVIYLEADNNYTIIRLTDNKRLVSSQTLGKFEASVGTNWFFRVHRSHIINLFHLQSFLFAEGGFAQMSNGQKIGVSGNRAKLLKDTISLFCTHLF